MKPTSPKSEKDLATLVHKILKKNGRDVVNLTVLERLEELHKAEKERDELQAALRSYLGASSQTQIVSARAKLFETLASQLNP